MKFQFEGTCCFAPCESFGSPVSYLKMTALEILRVGADFSHYAPLPPTFMRVSEAEYSSALISARKAAAVLREYGAVKVILFGSLARKEDFEPRSDIDLAVWGIPSKLFFAAGARVMDLDSSHEINIVDGATIPKGLHRSISKEGIPL